MVRTARVQPHSRDPRSARSSHHREPDKTNIPASPSNGKGSAMSEYHQMKRQAAFRMMLLGLAAFYVLFGCVVATALSLSNM
jgi:hypothetical protein